MKAQKKTAIASAVVVDIKGDASLANDAGKAQRLEALRNIDTAEDLFGSALIEGLRMTAIYGQTSKAEVAEGYTRCNNPDVYASWFNRGAKACAVIGLTATQQLIDKASEGKGGFQRAREALASICKQAKDAGAKELAPKAARMAVTAALKTAGDKSVTRSTTKTVVRARSTVNLAAAALEAGKGHKELAAFVKLASNTASRLPEREGREALHREAVAALALACEKWQLLAK